MTKPVTIPNTFATATTAIPLSQLDSDFSTVATALNDANTYSNYAADTGVANAYVVTLTGVSTTYSAGLRIQFKAGAANTGASTLNVNGGGTKNITYQDASALSAGTIAANAIVDVMYDGTQFLLMNDPAGTVGTGDVVGPAGATANAIVRFDSTTGKLVKNSVVTIADSTGDMSGVGALTATGNVSFDGGTFVFNESGADKDFRIEGDTDANLFFTDASTDRVGIGTSSPGYKLDVNGTFGLGTGQTGNVGVFGANTATADTYFRIRNTAGAFDVGTASSGHYFYGQGSLPLQFFTNSSERARITSGGYFKASNNGAYFGSTSSYHELRNTTTAARTVVLTHTDATQPLGIYVEYTAAAPNGTANAFLECVDTGGARFVARSNGGLANYSANDVNLSDRREKINFAPAKSYLETICAIPVQTFNYIDQAEDDPGLTLGVVAQDVQAVAPELVMESNWGTEENPKMRLSIYQTDLQYALMKCIQEQQALITSLTARIAALEGTQP